MLFLESYWICDQTHQQRAKILHFEMEGKTLQDSSSLENSSKSTVLSDKESNELTSDGRPSIFATLCVFWILSNDEYECEKLRYGCTMISLPWVTPGFASALDVSSVLDS